MLGPVNTRASVQHSSLRAFSVLLLRALCASVVNLPDSRKAKIMINVGVIGLGMMGNTHLDVYAKRPDVKVVAISDLNPDRLSGVVRAGGNIKGQAQGGFDIKSPDVKKYDEGMKLIRDKNVQLVDVCLWTPLHYQYASKALKAGKHVLSEKPMGRTAADAKRLAKAAEAGPGQFMVAQCMRFWPGWTWLKDAVTNNTYGAVKSAHFRRRRSPRWQVL